MAKKIEMTKRSRKALDALREAVTEAIADHRRAGVPIVVRTEKSASRRQPALVREAKATYRTQKSRKVDQ